MQQLTKNDSELASSVIANAGTRICFRLGDTDAKKFENGFSYFDAQDLQNLDTGEAIMRIERPDNDCNMKTLPFDGLEEDVAVHIKEMVIAASRARYGTPRGDVEAGMALEAGVNEPEALKEKAQQVRPVSPIQERKEEIQPPPPKILYPETPKDNSFERQQETQHRYLQTLIKKMAESRGYKAIIEEGTPDGKGRVDVGLLKGDARIAVEISVTTPDTWEIHNIEKCLAAGYNPVVVCATSKTHLAKIQKITEATLEPSMHSRVLFFEPEHLFLYLDQQVAQEISGEERMKGYRVKVEYNAVPDAVSKDKKDSIIRAVSDGRKKKRP